MGLSIHYRGRLNDKKDINRLVEEFKDIARINGWRYHCLDEDWEKAPTARLDSAEGPGIRIVGETRLKGLHFQPHERCEPVWLYFNAGGFLSTPFQVALDAEEGYPYRKNWVFTKTQFAGADTHMAIVKILRYLKETFITDLEVVDEGNYWESEDRQELQKRMDKLDQAMDIVEKALGKIESDENEDVESLSQKIEDMLRRMRGEGKNE